jgi:hypothetical protein
LCRKFNSVILRDLTKLRIPVILLCMSVICHTKFNIMLYHALTAKVHTLQELRIHQSIFPCSDEEAGWDTEVTFSTPPKFNYKSRLTESRILETHNTISPVLSEIYQQKYYTVERFTILMSSLRIRN